MPQAKNYYNRLKFHAAIQKITVAPFMDHGVRRLLHAENYFSTELVKTKSSYSLQNKKGSEVGEKQAPIEMIIV